MEGTTSKDVSRRVEINATPPPSVGSVSVRTSPNVTPGGDHVASSYAKQVEDIDENIELFATVRTKIKPRKWVKKHESQVGDRDKKVVVLRDGSKEVHMTQPVRFAVEGLIPWVRYIGNRKGTTIW